MHLKLLSDAKIAQKTVLLRVDYNVTLRKKDGHIRIGDDKRIKDSLPTLKYLLDHHCKIIVLAHAGRPDGKVVEDSRLNPIAQRLEKLLKHKIKKIDEVAGEPVQKAVKELAEGEILLLENIRFHPGETENDPSLAKFWASLADVYVNDGFSLCHRQHASVYGVAKLLPAYAGLALARETEMLSELVDKPKRPFVAIVGGAKISDKVEAIRNLSQVADVVLVGGGVANNFLKAEGIEVYCSYLEETKRVDDDRRKRSFVAVAEELIDNSRTEKMMLHGYIPLPKIIYPSDVIAAEEPQNPKKTIEIDLTTYNNGVKGDDWMFLDIGPHTQQLYRDIILEAKTVFWNGPMGMFEVPEFAEGTKAIAAAMAKSAGHTVIGGGDTISAVNRLKLADRYDYVSAAGGAALEFLGGKKLPGLEVLKK